MTRGAVPPRAMLLAAGRGERLRPITDTLPKPLVEVAGKPLIVYHLEALHRAGVREVVINLSWLGEKIRAALGDGGRYGVHISYSEEGPVPLETGGGIHRALPLLGSRPFLVVNADVWTNMDFSRVLTLDEGADARLMLAPNPPQHPRGDFGIEGDLVVERENERFTYTGVGMYRPEFFEGCVPGKFPLLPLLKRAIAARRLHGEVYGGEWLDIGSPDRLAWLDARERGAGRG
ncbi:MAG TPA: nucleotidyltransferase family protein [Steroidobacteraceae bacterium]|jgi:MurNAc alpha-1-phosphate uridylyltransferase|nr:nucleotidyltransferase family protein [Steroidobacteraceae bacterium]